MDKNINIFYIVINEQKESTPYDSDEVTSLLWQKLLELPKKFILLVTNENIDTMKIINKLILQIEYLKCPRSFVNFEICPFDIFIQNNATKFKSNTIGFIENVEFETNFSKFSYSISYFLTYKAPLIATITTECYNQYNSDIKKFIKRYFNVIDNLKTETTLNHD